MKQDHKEKIQVITTHINADFDAMASMIAAKKLYPKARMVFSGSQEKTLREFFVRSTFYIFDVDRIKDIDLDRVGLIVLVDTRQKSRIGPFSELLEKDDVKVHIYDHHPPSSDDIKGDLEVIREVGATTTILAGILKQRGLEPSPDEATIMAIGIHEDTGSLTFSSTTEEDYRAAGYLVSRGAKLSIISDMITRELTAEQVFLLNDLIQSAKKITIRGVEIVIAKASIDHYVGDFAVLVHKLRDMENVDVLFALARMDDRIYFVARSRIDSVNVGDIALEFGGGGHPTAASATIKDLTLIQVEERLLELLYQRMVTDKLARQIMSFPVKTIQWDETIEKAGEMMTLMNINSLPVMKGERLVGLISRMVIQKATYHGLKDLPVKEYMTMDFAVARPDTPIEELRRIIIETNQRFLPIMDGDSLVGAVTRTDLLRELRLEKESLGDPLYERYDLKRKNISKLIEERLPASILNVLRQLGKVADQLGFKAYAVGGFVRDILLQYENFDIDVVIEGDGILFARKFAEEFGYICRAHPKFKTAVVTCSEGLKVDIATARTEYYEYPGALPTVELSSIKLDLYRRDFTINTLAVRLNADHYGELLDFFGGQRDIKDRKIRVLHNLSFVEDPTRILRAIRFEQRYGFMIGKHALNLISNAVRLNLLGRLEGSRLWNELHLILKEPKPLIAIQRMADLGLLSAFHPSIRLTVSKKALLEGIEAAVSWLNLLFLEEKVNPWFAYFLGLIDDLTDQQVRELCRRLGFSEKESEKIAMTKYDADRSLGDLRRMRRHWPSRIYRLLRPLPLEALLYMMGKGRNTAVQRSISLYITKLRNMRPLMNGEDLKRLGLSPGPVFKRALQDLLDARLDGMLSTYDQEVEYIRKRYLGEALGSG